MICAEIVQRNDDVVLWRAEEPCREDPNCRDSHPIFNAGILSVTTAEIAEK